MNTPTEALPDVVPLRLLDPHLPSAEMLLPWLRRIDAARHYTNFGPLTHELESALSCDWATHAPTHVTTVSTGTDALALALSALDLPRGSRVLIPALTFSATAGAVIAAGLCPVLADVSEEDWMLSPVLAEKAMETGVVAAMPVAAFGRPVPVEPWDELAERSGLHVVIDAAGAFGDQGTGKRVGVAVSLHATKTLAAGEGGFFAAADPEWVGRVRALSNFGFENGIAHHPGGNAKLSEYHAAVALAGLQRWPQHSWRLRRAAGRYARLLSDELGEIIVLPSGFRPWARSTFVVRLPNGVPDELEKILALEGVPIRRWYCPPLHRHPAYADCERWGDLAVTERLSRQLLGLPFHTGLSIQDMRRVVAALARVLR